jgi:hypothetical protein
MDTDPEFAAIPFIGKLACNFRGLSKSPVSIAAVAFGLYPITGIAKVGAPRVYHLWPTVLKVVPANDRQRQDKKVVIGVQRRNA